MATHSSIPAWGNLMDRGAWQATVHGVARVGHDLATKQHNIKAHFRKVNEHQNKETENYSGPQTQSKVQLLSCGSVAQTYRPELQLLPCNLSLSSTLFLKV